MRRISDCGKIQNTPRASDKILNVLIYGAQRFDEIQCIGVGEHVEWPKLNVNDRNDELEE